MRTNKNYYPVYIKLNIGLAKKFVWGFPYDVTDKSEQKVLANTVFKIISDGLSELKSGYLRSLP